MRLNIITLFMFLLFSVVFAQTIFFEYSATPSTNQVVVNWKTSSETNVENFVILRSSDDNVFIEIGSAQAKGVGTEYKFVDENVIFKGSNTFFYKIKAVKSNGVLIEETQSLMVNPNISGIFRTWGAIKAMFR
mgnify:CR=1 FL=1